MMYMWIKRFYFQLLLQPHLLCFLFRIKLGNKDEREYSCGMTCTFRFVSWEI